MLLLSRSEIASLLTFRDYVCVVEEAFRRHAEGASFEPALAHVNADEGEFHIKAGGLRGSTPYFGLKVNGGFFQNRARFGLPNIQGLIVLSRADNGVLLAAMDSIEITIQRTAAATAVAAKSLARPDSRVCTVCGCGTQGRAQLRALRHVLSGASVRLVAPARGRAGFLRGTEQGAGNPNYARDRSGRGAAAERRLRDVYSSKVAFSAAGLHSGGNVHRGDGRGQSG